MNAVTAPLTQRAPMRAQPWLGFFRSLLWALWPGVAFPAAAAPPWAGAARQRRALLLGLLLGTAAAAGGLAAPGLPWPLAALQALLLTWLALGVATALMGAWVLLRGDKHALRLNDAQVPIARSARTALIMPICNEDIATVFGGLGATCESLAATGALQLFDIYILSDTSDPTLRAAELRAWQRLRDVMGDSPVREGGRIFYRWRRHRTRRKAGNVADFCRRWGSLYRYMVVLDADSTMSGPTLLSLVRLMEQHPQAGIIQTLPQAGGHPTLHARLQQFASRVTGRLFALGMAYWQLGDSHYWGHNAILRVAPFMRHCGLGALPGRGGLAGDIMSHDFVEAALMRRAGFGVWLAPQLTGSWEQQPPNLLAELQRDRRWCQGNLQNARLLAEPGWQPAHRAMFAAGALSYAVAPLWLLFVAIGLWLDAPVGYGAADGFGAGAGLWWLTAGLLLLPRAMGVAAVRLAGEQRLFGGTPRLLVSAALEATMAAVQAPLRMLAHSLFVVVALSGLQLGWKSPPRDAERVRWTDAATRIGLLAAAALALTTLASAPGDRLSWHLAPLWLPLLLAVPYTVWTGSAWVGLLARRAGLLATPEESRPPRTLARAAEAIGFGLLQPAAAHAAAAPDATSAAWRAFGSRAQLAVGVALLCALFVLPRPGITPVLPPDVGGNWFSVSAAADQKLPPRSGLAEAMQRARPTAISRPAQRIDDALRERAVKAVQRAQAEEDYERLIWSLASAAANAP